MISAGFTIRLIKSEKGIINASHFIAAFIGSWFFIGYMICAFTVLKDEVPNQPPI